MTTTTIAAAGTQRRTPAWLRLLRPHFASLSLSAGLAGMAVGADDPTAGSIAVGVLTCTLAYSLGQVTNDYFDREADAINAPDRPFVTGEVNPNRALAAVAAVMVALFAGALLTAPAAAVWGLIAAAGHGLYTLTKGVPFVGNFANGPSVAAFTLVGAAAAAPDRGWTDMPGEALLAAALITPALTALGMVSYFKDVPGDTAVGYRTFVVALGPSRARWAVPPFFVAALAGAVVLGLGGADAIGGDANAVFWTLLALAAIAIGAGMRLLFAAPEANSYAALVWVTRGTVAFALALGAACEPMAFLAIAVPLGALLELALRDTEGTGQA